MNKIQSRLTTLVTCLAVFAGVTQLVAIAALFHWTKARIQEPDASPPPPDFLWGITFVLSAPLLAAALTEFVFACIHRRRKTKSLLALAVISVVVLFYASFVATIYFESLVFPAMCLCLVSQFLLASLSLVHLGLNMQYPETREVINGTL